MGFSAPQALDELLLRAARTWGHGDPRVERAVALYSRLGEHGAVWLVLGAAGWALDGARRPQWRNATVTVAGTYAANTTLKLAVGRSRPELPGLPPLTSTPTRLSFPSAHASTSFAAARLYARLGLPVPALYALAGSLSLSRLYLGVHYPSDVLAGAALGALAGTRWGAEGVAQQTRVTRSDMVRACPRLSPSPRPKRSSRA